jgi:hypothetical protein
MGEKDKKPKPAKVEPPLESPVDAKFKKHKEKKKRITRDLVKIIGANIVNVILIVSIFYILGQLPDVAQKIKELRSAQIASQEVSDVAVIQSEIDRNADKIQELRNLFIDDEQFIVFIRELNALQIEGIVSEFDLTGGKTTVNKDGTSVLPVIIVFQGQKEQINSALKRIHDLPILLRPSAVELVSVSASEENPGGYIMNYTAFLIVDGDFAAN